VAVAYSKRFQEGLGGVPACGKKSFKIQRVAYWQTRNIKAPDGLPDA